ncbi:MAG: phosphate ABC transporter ATP-binding protein [Bacteroidales bacterium]|nr:phosphate ABC transporter ATP-binding protein [Bacteroidales bacterium]
MNELLKIENLNAYFDKNKVLKNINVVFYEKKITALMGPSGCGKTTLLRCINRMHELNENAWVEGNIFLKDGENKFIDVYSHEPSEIRRKIGMVFQKPNPFPTMTIFENVISGFILNGIKLPKKQAEEIVEETLKKVGLWDEVKEKLNKRGTFLSGGQQQRLCFARALAIKPTVLLLDEPTSALDPIATKNIEDLIITLKDTVSIIIVTHNVGQAGRISDYVAFMYLGNLLEYGETEKVFTTPINKKTEEFLTGKIG